MDDQICGLLWSLSRNSPCLRKICIFSHEQHFSPESGLALSGLLLSLSGVEIIEVEVTDMSLPARAVVDHIGTLSSLISWESLMFPPDPDLASFTTQGGRFSNLSPFSFSMVDLATAGNIVESMTCSFTLLDIKIRRSRPWVMTETARSLRRITEVLSRHQSSGLALRVMPDMVTGGESVHAALRPLLG